MGRAWVGLLALGCAAAGEAQLPVEEAKALPPAGPTVVQLAAGTRSTCALSQGGKVVCVGALFGRGTARNVPRTVAGLPEIVRIAMAADFGCGQSVDGEVWCWSETPRSETHPGGELTVHPVREIAGARSLAAAGSIACADVGTELRCWRNPAGPAASTFVAGGWSPGDDYVLTHDALCWGTGGRLTCSQSPAQRSSSKTSTIEVVGEVLPHAADGDFAEFCWIDPDAEVRCAARRKLEKVVNVTRRLGAQGPRAFSTGHGMCHIRRRGVECLEAPGLRWLDEDDEIAEWTHVGDNRVTGVAVGEHHQCGLGSLDRVFCWGSNQDGQIAGPAMEIARDPVKLTVSGATDVAVTPDSVCVLAKGQVLCTREFDGCEPSELTPITHGAAERTHLQHAFPGACFLENGRTWRCFESGKVLDRELPASFRGRVTHADDRCFLRDDGALACAVDRFEPIEVMDGVAASTRIAAGLSVACRLDKTGQTWCWTSDRRADRPLWKPVPDPGAVEDVKLAAALRELSQDLQPPLGARSAIDGCRITGAGAVRCDGPTPLPGKAVGLSGTARRACALSENGRVYCWGDRGRQGFGDGARWCADELTDVTEPFVVALAESNG